jgi:hypothetical protein
VGDERWVMKLLPNKFGREEYCLMRYETPYALYKFTEFSENLYLNLKGVKDVTSKKETGSP